MFQCWRKKRPWKSLIKRAALLALIMLLCSLMRPTPATASVTRADNSSSVTGVNAVAVDLTDPNIRFLSLSAGKVGDVAAFTDIIKQVDTSKYEVLAAINGAFFNSYTGTGQPQPIMGSVFKEGVVMHQYGGTLIGFAPDGTVKINYAGIRVIGYVDSVRDKDHSFYVHNWNVIRPSGSDYRETLLNAQYGTQTGEHDMLAITVQNDLITAIGAGNTAIPADGYVYLMPSNSPYADGRFYVGGRIELERTFTDLKTQADITATWSNMTNITGCGPSLVLNGSITADAQSEGWSDPNLTTNAAQRSFIGLDAGGQKLVMGTAPNCTIAQLAEVARSFGLHDAMNLDGGASSALFFNGTVLTTPGRPLSNIIAVVRLKDGANTASPAVPANPNSPSTWALTQVEAAITAGLVPQTLQAQYTQAITRAEFCALAVALYETYTGTEIEERESFGDTNDVNVEKAAAIGVVTGTGANQFSPTASLTREQAATMLSRLAEAIGAPLSGSGQGAAFADSAAISGYAVDAVRQVQAAGIMSGVGENTFAPQGAYTREQSIITIIRLWDIIRE